VRRGEEKKEKSYNLCSRIKFKLTDNACPTSEGKNSKKQQQQKKKKKLPKNNKRFTLIAPEEKRMTIQTSSFQNPNKNKNK
jgi:hypothetical protein